MMLRQFFEKREARSREKCANHSSATDDGAGFFPSSRGRTRGATNDLTLLFCAEPTSGLYASLNEVI
jgi:hypothetical protein